jgi:hypothetical protein
MRKCRWELSGADCKHEGALEGKEIRNVRVVSDFNEFQ